VLTVREVTLHIRACSVEGTVVLTVREVTVLHQS